MEVENQQIFRFHFISNLSKKIIIIKLLLNKKIPAMIISEYYPYLVML